MEVADLEKSDSVGDGFVGFVEAGQFSFFPAKLAFHKLIIIGMLFWFT